MNVDQEWITITCDEHDRLIAELDRLRATAAWDVKILNAEIDRLRELLADRKDRYRKLEDENDLLRAENAEMRQFITDLLTDDFEYNWPDRARAILAKSGKPDYAPARDPSSHQACGGNAG